MVTICDCLVSITNSDAMKKLDAIKGGGAREPDGRTLDLFMGAVTCSETQL